MKKIYIGVLGMTLLFLATVAFAKPCGMWATDVQVTAEQQKFFDETRDLRKEMHEKKFELRELYLTNADQAKIDALQTDIEALRAKIQDKAKDLKITSGPGACADQGAGCFTGQGRGCNGNGPCGKQVARGCGNMMDRCGQ